MFQIGIIELAVLLVLLGIPLLGGLAGVIVLLTVYLRRNKDKRPGE